LFLRICIQQIAEDRSMTTAARKRFRELLAAPEVLILPGAYDALSARMIEAAGFDAVTAGGLAGIASMMAEPDIGQSNVRDYADHYARVCGAVTVPVTVDGDTGFGDVNNVRQMVRAFEAAGVAAFFINDQVFPQRCGYLPGKRVVPVEDMLSKIKAAVDARRDESMVIGARTDAALISGLSEAIDRSCLFLEAGADIAKPQCVDKPEDIARVVREVPSPHITTLSQAAGKHKFDIADLSALGVAAISLPSIALFSAMTAVKNNLATLKRENSLGAVAPNLFPLEEYFELTGLHRLLAREKEYQDAARDLTARTARKQSA
jgi:2-methylisocitrate lyase-like PEP mutase family enzyme